MYYKSLGFLRWTGFKASMLIVMSYSSMCTLSREIYSEGVEITIKIGTSAIGKMT